MTDESELKEFRKSFPDNLEGQLSLAKKMLCEDTEFLHAAVGCYEHVLGRGNEAEATLFANGFLGSWSEFTINALSAGDNIKPASSIQPVTCFDNPSDPTIYAGWHYPEYPLLMRALARNSIFTLIAQDSAWLIPVSQANLAINFKERQSRRAISEAFKKRRSMSLMIDYCYKDTRGEPIAFLGLRCLTPIGIIRRAMSEQYRIGVVSVTAGTAHCDYITYSAADTPETVTVQINGLISENIIRAPNRWLLWPSLFTRVVPR